jgi:small subunit ribosomal protein S16
MAVAIRLRREGALNRPYFKVVVTDKRSPRDGKFIEIVGTYDPKKPGLNSTLKLDRIEHWISKGAQPSDTVRSLIKKTKNPQAAAKKAEAAAAKKAASKPTKAPPASEPPPAPIATETPAAAESPAESAPATPAAEAATEEKSAS